MSLAPNLKPFTDLLGVDVETVKKVLGSWGPGRYDAVLDKDGKALRPDGKQAGTLIPPAFGLAGVNLATWTGFGSVTYWNAYVAGTQMHGAATFFDARFNNKDQYPVSAKSGSGNTRNMPDKTTPSRRCISTNSRFLRRRHQPGHTTRPHSNAERRSSTVQGSVRPVTYRRSTPSRDTTCTRRDEIGIDSFQADRSPTHMYRTAPLAGLWTHQKGGFFHDGRFATLLDVVDHYDAQFKLNLSDTNKKDLVEYLKGI